MSVLYTLYTTTYSSARVILSGFRVVMTRGLIPIRRERNGPAAAAGPEGRTRKTLRPDRVITATTAQAMSCWRQTRPKRYCVSSPSNDEHLRPRRPRCRRARYTAVTTFGGV